jgi:hypothetical protein
MSPRASRTGDLGAVTHSLSAAGASLSTLFGLGCGGCRRDGRLAARRCFGKICRSRLLPRTIKTLSLP